MKWIFFEFSFQNLLLLLYFYSLPYQRLHLALVWEDSWGEWAQFFVYLAAALLALYLSFKTKSLKKMENILLAVFLFLLAGEEISWAQRIFKFSVPSIEKINERGEVNIHNLFPLYGNVSVYVWFAILFGFVVPLSIFLLNRFTRMKWKTAFYSPVFLLIYFELLIFYLVLPQNEYIFFYEFSELVIAFSFLFLILREIMCNTFEQTLC